MTEKKRLFYFTLVFGIFFLTIGLTGYLQVSTLKKNMETLLSKEAEMVYGHLLREIDIYLEYLDLFDRSRFVITPSFLDVMAYEEAVIEDLIENLSRALDMDVDQIPLSNYILLDRKGAVLQRKGNLSERERLINALVSGKERVLLRGTTNGDEHLILGLRLDDKIIVLSLSKSELAELKKKYVLKEIAEREVEKVKLAGLNIYDPNGSLYYSYKGQGETYYRYRRALDSKYLRGYAIEILLSRKLVDETLKRTAFHLTLTLLLLITFTALAGYAIFLVEKRLERKMIQFEREMARKERLLSLGMLSSTMAHEIRNPLNAISLSIERLKREFLPNDNGKNEHEKFLDFINKEVKRINRIVEDFLFLSKSEPVREEIDLKEMMDELFVILREKAESKGVELINLISHKIKITGQKEKLKQAFFNFILNSIEAIESDGYVKVDAKEDEKETTILVEDNGCGIKREEIENIFEYHYTTKDKGIGLGLPISYMILKDHGAQIKVESEKGKGTILRVMIPRFMEKT